MSETLELKPQSVQVLLIVSEDRTDETLGVGYLAAALRSAGTTCEIVRWAVEDERRSALDRLASSAPLTLVGITWLFDSSAAGVLRISAAVKETRPTVPIVVGGHPPSLSPEWALRTAPHVDMVLCGEADLTIVQLATALSTHAPLFVPGLVSREPCDPMPPAQISDLSKLPWPARDTLKAMIASGREPDSLSVRLSTSRGCYAHCDFCSMVSFYALDGTRMRWRQRDVDDVVGEMSHLMTTLGVHRFWFVDDEFIGPPKLHGQRAVALAQAIRDTGLLIEWGFEARAGGVLAMSQADLGQLIEGGARVAVIGFESGSQAALDRFNKGTSATANYDAIEHLRSAGLDYRYGFIMFDPETTFTDLAQNIAFLRFAEPHRIVNSGPERLLNAEFPEVGTSFAQRLNVDTTSEEARSASTKPRIPSLALGYEFRDPRVRNLRDLLLEFARTVVTPASIARPTDAPDIQMEAWWHGTNYLPRNVAAINAFLDVFDWAVANYREDWTELPERAHQVFDGNRI